MGLNFLHVVQIRYCKFDIIHTVRYLAGTQQYFVLAVTLVQIPLQISIWGSCCFKQRIFQVQKNKWINLFSEHKHKVTLLSLYLSFLSAIIFPSICRVLWALPTSFHALTHSPFIRSHSIFFCIIAAVLCTAKRLFELEGLSVCSL